MALGIIKNCFLKKLNYNIVIPEKEIMKKRFYFSGNEAIGVGLLKAGVRFLTGYPGTPSSEILPTFQRLAKKYLNNFFADWCINEKVAYEVAYAASLAGIPAAVTMKQVGLNVAMDPFMNSAYVGTDGGFVVVSVDDPGPHSSQTEQDSRFMAMAAKVPVLDPSDIKEAYFFSQKALSLSREFKIPVLLRSTTRVSHGRAGLEIEHFEPLLDKPAPSFKENLKTWKEKLKRLAATPKLRFLLHKELNQKLEQIASENKPRFFFEGDIAIITSGGVFSYLYELIEEHSLEEKICLVKFDLPFPIDEEIKKELKNFRRIIAVEESMPVLELQLCAEGRNTGIVPKEGELTPAVCEEILSKLGLLKKKKHISFPPLPRPSLCPGCPHRIGLFALKKAFGNSAIYTGDIGCYTLALNFGVTDTVLCMGAGVSFSFGIKKAFQMAEKGRAVIGIVGDSTFFHSGIPALIDLYHYGIPVLIVILDNGTVAMTGNQKTPSSSQSFSGEKLNPVSIEKIVEGIGVEFCKVVDPYEFKEVLKVFKEAKKFLESSFSPAVVILRHLCINTKEGFSVNPKYRVKIIEERCTGCKVCINEFECPALYFDEEKGKVFINQVWCIGCGCCVYACPKGAIERESR